MTSAMDATTLVVLAGYLGAVLGIAWSVFVIFWMVRVLRTLEDISDSLGDIAEVTRGWGPRRLRGDRLLESRLPRAFR
jgi:hypothetical protein